MVLLNLVVNGVTLMFAVVSAVTGAFGMNLNAWMPQGTKQSAVRRAYMPYVCHVIAAIQACTDAWLHTADGTRNGQAMLQMVQFHIQPPPPC